MSKHCMVNPASVPDCLLIYCWWFKAIWITFGHIYCENYIKYRIQIYIFYEKKHSFLNNKYKINTVIYKSLKLIRRGLQTCYLK